MSKVHHKKVQPKILVVDDEPDLVNILESRLRTNGYEVLTALDGLNGLLAAKREQPDLMLLDVMIPKIDGFSVCRLLKFDEKYQDITIVILSALNQEKDSLLGREVGADAYLTKPFDANTLLETIKQLLWD